MSVAYPTSVRISIEKRRKPEFKKRIESIDVEISELENKNEENDENITSKNEDSHYIERRIEELDDGREELAVDRALRKERLMADIERPKVDREKITRSIACLGVDLKNLSLSFEEKRGLYSVFNKIIELLKPEEDSILSVFSRKFEEFLRSKSEQNNASGGACGQTFFSSSHSSRTSTRPEDIPSDQDRFSVPSQ